MLCMKKEKKLNEHGIAAAAAKAEDGINGKSTQKRLTKYHK